MSHPAEKNLRIRSARAILGLAVLIQTTGCAVGPDFHRPPAPVDQKYTRHPVSSSIGQKDDRKEGVQTLRVGADIPGQWWHLFHSKALNRLVEKALLVNPDLHAAEDSLLEAMDNVSAGRGAFAPTVGGNLQTVQQYFNGAAFGLPQLSNLFTLNTGSVSVSYPLDLFGGIRRQVESLKAQEDYQRFELEAAYLTLTSNIVLSAVQEASLTEQIRATRSIVKALRKERDSVRRQFDIGLASRSAVLVQETTLAQEKATLPGLEKQRSLVRHQLSVYLGRFPGEKIGAQFQLSDLHLPDTLPLSLPSRLVDHRPDIQAASAQLHAASAQVGVATANMLPQISLSGQYGSESIAGYFAPGSQFWRYGPSLNVPLFQGGTLFFRRKAAIAALKQAKAKYESAVLAAFQNVADALRTLSSDAETLKAQKTVFLSSEESFRIARHQFAVGAIGYPSLYNAEQNYEQSRIGLIQARAARLSDTAALFQALGGGWWNMAPATPKGVGIRTKSVRPASKGKKT